MTVRRPVSRTLVICLLILFLLAGCSGAVSPAAAPVSSPAVAAGSTAPVTLYLWYAWPFPEQRVLAGLVEQFNRTNLDVRVIAQIRPIASLTSDMRAAVSEGQGPHLVIVQSHALGLLVEEGVLLRLDDLISPTELARLLPVTLGAARLQIDDQEGLYGVPISFDTLALFYSRANWLQPPVDTETWLDSARTLTDTSGSPPTWGMAYHLSLDKTIGYFYAFGGQLFDDEGMPALGTTGRNGAVRWLEWLMTLKQDPRLLASLDYMAVENALLSQQALMTVDWSYALPVYQRLWGENLGVALLPRLTEEDRLPQPYVQSDLIALNGLLQDSAEQRAAITFIRFMIGEAAQRRLLQAGRQPADVQLVLDPDDPAQAVAAVFREQAGNALPMPNSRAAATIVWPLLDELRFDVLRGLADPQQAVDSADATLRERLDIPPLQR